MESEDNIQWHPAFCSAMELELRDYKQHLHYIREFNLGKMPLKIDFLIIKKKTEIHINNEIADFFLENNIFEYKSPGDSVNTGTFYKALSYACLYKAESGNLGESLDMDITVSLVREQKPVKLLQQLSEKFEVTRKADGIYRIHGMLFPMQILITGELDERNHVWVTSLSRTMDKKRAQRLLNTYSKLMDEEDRKNADSVVNVASEANIDLFRKMIQEGSQMCEELKEMLAPEIVEFKMRLAEQNKQIADMNAKLADNAAKLADNAAKLADRDAKLADNAAKIKELSKKLADAGIQI